ncbi:MAG: sigma-70 family RNA polymerase sigma factor [Deltaproteobacteria bacterium]|nr:sigma-70 family RNA polymerase sigma factor [Deltaproteobacteria bacterium]
MRASSRIQESSSLIAAAQNGDRKALERLLQAEQRRIYAFGLRMCGNASDASDVLQETMLAVTRNIGTFRGDASLSTWLFQIARSFCIKNRRRRKGAPKRTEPLDVAKEETLADDSPSPEQTTRRKELAAQLNEALATMAAPAREVLVLRDVEGLTAPEVARVLGISVEAVKSKLHRARASLQAALAPHLDRGPHTKGRDCPDILAMYSKQLEGELTSAMCAKMEKHVARCQRCSGACDALKRSLALCKTQPVVPSDIQRTVRRSLRRILASSVKSE